MSKEIDFGFVPISSWENNSFSNSVLKANTEYTLRVDYPLGNPYEEKFQTGKVGMSKEALINKICTTYKAIYQEEAATSGVKVGTLPGMYNRNKTNGKYGICNHVIEDLCLVSASIDKKNVITLGV